MWAADFDSSIHVFIALKSRENDVLVGWFSFVWVSPLLYRGMTWSGCRLYVLKENAEMILCERLFIFFNNES